MSRIVATAAALLTVAFMLAAPLVRAADAPAPAPQPRVVTDAAPQQRSLDRQMTDLRLNASSLGDVIDFLADISGVNMAVDWKALDAANVTKETSITLRLGSTVTLRKALKLILQQAGGAGALTFYADQGVLQITTQEQADKELITRIYGIQDLLFEATDYYNAPNLNLTQANQGSGGGRGAGGGGSNQQLFQNVNQGGNNGQNARTRTDRANEIIKLITETVRPEVWQVNGGSSTIGFIRGNLVVSAPRSVHEQLSSK